MLSSRPIHHALDGPHYPTKTPIRLKNRAENAGVKTVGPKGKGIILGTPAAGLKGGFATTGKSRPFLDKTPFPNRQQPNYGGGEGKDSLGKLPKLVLLETAPHAATPDIQRPSSTRKHPRLPHSADKNFKTPANKGNHWDVPDLDLELPEAQVEQESVPQDDFDEIEYMAPNTLDLPYQPPFDFELPDYKVLGQAFRKAIFSPLAEDRNPVFEDPAVVEVPPMASLPLKEIDDDDPFKKPMPKAAVGPKPLQSRAPIRRPMSTVPPTTSTLRTRTTRPATSMAVKAPTASGARVPLKPTVATRPGARLPASSSSAKPKPPTGPFAFNDTLAEDDFLFSV
ncbi:hypothetical protein BKA70DRAFT_410675 [Coprinopsis sp. MPI-PUGE-AT-0042]|nr:hypothetical protein BKA70DRAFT_410675 [Coprinopsis sp. MPI-PUGE-AT-0042]